MAVFEKENEKKEYLAMLDANGEMVAIINPMKGVPMEMLKEAMTGKGLNVEIRESKSDRVEINL
jgi:hypothetical protein